jgi:TonB-linked SusC/RagA family outer membrane protein
MRRLALLSLGLLLFSMQLLAQNRTVSGTVSDSLGQGLTGVSVRVPGTKVGTTTDARGSFSLNVPPTARNLEISNVGFATQIIAIPASNSVSLMMHQDAGAMNEIVVTGITRSRRSQYAGAATKIDEKQISDRPVGSFDQLFQGRVPGLLALTGSGQPGNATTTIIRGQNSISGGVTPLYVVDGIPVEPDVFQGLNPNDFESIDVLRDATATSLYGSRGSAGVIVVSTKRGQSGKMKLQYGGQFGMKSRPEFTWDMMTTSQLFQSQEDFGRIVNVPNTGAARDNLPGWYYSKNNPAYAALTASEKTRYDFIRDSMSKINTNWRDEFFRDGSFSNHQVSISGGTGKTRIYSSLGLYNEEGTTLRTDMKRGTWRNNIDYADEKLSLAISTNIGFTKRNFQQTTANFNLGNPFLVMNVNAPYHVVKNPDGSYATGTGSKFEAANTLDITSLDMNYNNQVKATVGITSAYQISDNFTAGITTGIDFRETQSSNYGSKLAYIRMNSSSPRGQAGFQSEGLTRFVQVDVRPSLGYHKVINGIHDLDVTAYGEYIKQASKSFAGTGYGIDPRTPNTPAAITPGDDVNQLFQSVTGDKSQNSLLSGLLTARYSYQGKYR